MKRCGAKRGKGRGPCRAPAGSGTDHVGYGRCKWHGGNAPSGRKAGRKEAALAFARGALGADLPASPVDAMEESVRLAAGLIDYYRHQLAEAAATKGGPDLKRIGELVGPYTDAIRLEKDVAAAALSAGVAERRQRLAEREAELFAAAIADGLREAFGELATPERRAVFADVVERRLLVLEGTGEELPALAA